MKFSTTSSADILDLYVYRGPDCLYVYNIRKHIQLVQVCRVIYSDVYSCSDFIMWIPGQEVEARTQSQWLVLLN